MRYYYPLLITAGTLALVACQQPDDDDKKTDDPPHPPIEETLSGNEVGSAGHHSKQEPGSGEATKEGIKSAQNEDADAKDEDTSTFENKEFGVRIVYPKSLEEHAGDGEGNDKKAGWNAFADADADPGDAVRLLTLTVAGSNDASRAELRLGANRATEALTHCTDVPAGAAQTKDEENRRTIDGVPFTTFEVDNVTEDHYERIRSYRATYTQACYAIDMIASGSGKQGEGENDPKQAFDKLQAALDGFEFTK